MKKYRYIHAKESIASYMVGFDTNTMSIADYTNWSQYLANTLTTDKYETIVFYGKRYLDELKHEDDGFLFDISDASIKLAKDKTKKDLDEHILAYVDADKLIDLLHAPEGYNQSPTGDDFIL